MYEWVVVSGEGVSGVGYRRGRRVWGFTKFGSG